MCVCSFVRPTFGIFGNFVMFLFRVTSDHFGFIRNILEYYGIELLELSITFGIIESFWNYLELLGMFRDFRIFLELLEIF